MIRKAASRNTGLNADIRMSGYLPRPVITGKFDGSAAGAAVMKAVYIEMVHQMPVNRGDLRRSVEKTEKSGKYVVGPTLRRAIPLHAGTNKYRGSSRDYGVRGGGRVRQARYTKEDIIMFKTIQKRTRGKGISVPPDKFRDRTYKVIKPKVSSIAQQASGEQFKQRDRI